MTFKAFSGALLCLAMGLGFISHSHSIQAEISQPAAQRMAVKAGPPMPALPIAVYKNIKVDDLNKLLIDSFSESNFSLLAARKVANAITEFEFSYPIYKDGRPGSVVFKFLVDGTVVNGKCMDCFLRSGWLQDEGAIRNLPWMTQYDLNNRLYPDMDKSYLSIKNRSQAHLDSQLDFRYSNRWVGERNRLPESNSYVGVKLPDLKREVARALTDSGFILLRGSDANADAPDSSLAFSFPIDSGKPDGAIYAIRFTSQFDADGLCYPCETTQVYDPYQTLPSPGLFAMPGRLTLASRFESGFSSAYDRIKASTERHLRPGTQFIRPAKPLAPGTSRPQSRPMVAT